MTAVEIRHYVVKRGKGFWQPTPNEGPWIWSSTVRSRRTRSMGASEGTESPLGSDANLVWRPPGDGIRTKSFSFVIPKN